MSDALGTSGSLGKKFFSRFVGLIALAVATAIVSVKVGLTGH